MQRRRLLSYTKQDSQRDANKEPLGKHAGHCAQIGDSTQTAAPGPLIRFLRRDGYTPTKSRFPTSTPL
jgi:hypothetical protein